MNILNNYNAAIRFTRGLAFSFEEFLHQYDERDRVTADFSYITGHEQPFGPHSYIRRTIINELTPSAEDILKGFNDTTRKYLHHVMRNDLCRHEFVPDPSESEVLRIYDHIARFATAIGISAINLNYLKALHRAKRLHISYTFDQNGVMLTGYGYRLSALRPEQVYAIRAIEPDADDERVKLLNKASRYNLYRDMLHLKSLGFTEYDFSGYDGQSDDAKMRRIDEFKLAFGGTVRTYYNSILYNTIKSKTYIALRGSTLK